MRPLTLASRHWPARATDDHGHDPPKAVLLHGITGSGATWWRFAPVLATRGWEVVAIDLRGHGMSPRIEEPITVRDLAADVAATIRDDPEHRTVDLLLGHSLGAAVAMETVLAHPDIARRVVLEDPPGAARNRDEDFAQHLLAEATSFRRSPAAAVIDQISENPTWQLIDVLQNVESLIASDTDGLVRSVRQGLEQRVVEIAPAIGVPALYVLAGEPGSVMTGEQRRRLLSGLPPTSGVIEVGSGHTIHRDRFERYVEIVTGWLETVAAEA